MIRQHPTALIDPAAKIGSEVEIGPYCVIGPDVELGDRCKLHSHVVVTGCTRIGARCEIFPFASLGESPQDMKYAGEKSRLEIGENNVIREYVTMNPGTAGGGMLTEVGANGLFMMHAHVAHDCHIGKHVIFANGATLGGHCTVEDYSVLGGHSAVHQFVRIGAYAFIGGMSGAESDVIPFGVVVGLREGLAGLNIIGMKRHGFSREQIQTVRNAYKMLFAPEGTLQERIEKVAKAYGGEPPVNRILDFVRADTPRPIMLPK